MKSAPLGTARDAVRKRIRVTTARILAEEERSIPPVETGGVASTDDDGARLLDDLVRYVRSYVVLAEEQLIALALWTIHTHAIVAAETTPYLNITSAEKQSGKTRLLEVLELLVREPWFTGRTSAAALIRKVDAMRPTLLLDETDAAFKSDREYSEALRGVLNSGHRRGGRATVCVGKGADIKPRDFDVFGAKALAGIGNRLPDTVRDRSIPIELKRQASHERVQRFHRRAVAPVAEVLRSRIDTWVLAQLDVLRQIEPAVIYTVSDRAFDGWEPLLAIAQVAGRRWLDSATRAANSLSGNRPVEDDSIGVQLLHDIRVVFRASSAYRLHTDALLERLCAMPESPWHSYDDKPLSPQGLSQLLRRYKIRSRQVWLDAVNKHGYVRADFEDAWRRYLPTTAKPARVARNKKTAKESPLNGVLGECVPSDTDYKDIFGNIDDLAQLADAPAVGSEFIEKHCDFHVGKAGKPCNRCGVSWAEHCRT